MTISGFSFVRNGIKLYYPVQEAIRSILPICSEFVIAIGQGDPDDKTREQVATLKDPRIKIIDTVWEEKYFKKGIINSTQTDIAMHSCSGDWLFYLQADEVVHEKFLPVIQQRCEQLQANDQVEGLLFGYRHFWGDYEHYHAGHGWYPHEIRIVRNLPQIHSYQSAQSFRWFDYYDNPRQEKGTRKLNVAAVDAQIYHYGWVRPPHLMQNKRRSLDSVHWGLQKASEHYSKERDYFDYGPLDLLEVFRGTHPRVMEKKIAEMNWRDKLIYSGKPDRSRIPHKHELFKYRLLSKVEKVFNGGRQIGGFKNYRLLKGV